MDAAQRTTPPTDARPVGVLVVAGVVAVVVGGAVGGAFAALAGFADGGAVVRWGLPLSKVVLDVAAVLTVGLLLLAGTIVPERAHTRRRRFACEAATLTGGAWVVTGLFHLALLVANLAGIAPGEPGYLAALGLVTDITPTRVHLVSLLVALGATVLAAAATSRAAMTWAAALALVALVLLSLTGHAAGSFGHDTAVNAMAIHLATLAVWVGGLGALVFLRPALGGDVAVSVARFSTLAGWAYAGIAVSGALNAWVRIGSLAGLASAYGALLLAKLGLLVLLGFAGLHLRRRVVDRLTRDDGSRAAFAAVALGELALMGGALGLGVALSRTQPPPLPIGDGGSAVALTGYPAPDGPLVGWGWLTTFRPDWLWLAVALIAIGLYLAGHRRLARRGDTWPWLRTGCWVVGWLLFIWVTNGAPAVYGRVQFSVHMLMHMMLTMGVPVLLALAAPLTLAARTLTARKDKTLGPRELLLAVAHSRVMNVLANPIVAAVNFVGSLYLFYFTPLFDLALRTHVGHMLMVVHFMLAGYVFAWALVGADPGPRRWPPSLRLVLLFATMSAHAFFGVAIVSSTTVLAEDFFARLALPWVPDLLADQRVGGLITWGIGEIPMLLLALMVTAVWMRSDEQEARRRDRQADRDHDAELEAYNAELARRGEAYRRAEEREAARAEAAHAAREQARQQRRG